MTDNQTPSLTSLIPQDQPADPPVIPGETAVLAPTPPAATTASAPPSTPPPPAAVPTPALAPAPVTIDGPHWSLIILGLLGLLTAGWFYAAARWDWDFTLRWSTYSTAVSIGLGVALVALGLIGITRSSARRR